MEQELKEFGMSENEILVYLALLRAGVVSANRISELTGMKRSTTYDNLKLLMSKGVVSSRIKDRVSYYLAVDPEKIIDLIDERKARIIKIIPKLKEMRETIGNKTGVSFFEGKKGVLTVLNDIIDEKKELWFYGSRKMALIALKYYPENFIQKRAEQGIRLRAVLADEDKGDKAYDDKKIFKLSNLRFSDELNKIKANVFIYGDKVAFMTSTENPTGIIIENSEILAQQKTIFESLWRNSKNG